VHIPRVICEKQDSCNTMHPKITNYFETKSNETAKIKQSRLAHCKWITTVIFQLQQLGSLCPHHCLANSRKFFKQNPRSFQDQTHLPRLSGSWNFFKHNSRTFPSVSFRSKPHSLSPLKVAPHGATSWLRGHVSRKNDLEHKISQPFVGRGTPSVL